MTDAEKRAFNRGYLIACCNVANLHDEPCIASDVLAEAGISKREVKAMDLAEYDSAALREIRKSRTQDPLS